MTLLTLDEAAKVLRCQPVLYPAKAKTRYRTDRIRHWPRNAA
jgi:hypothetical protein